MSNIAALLTTWPKKSAIGEFKTMLKKTLIAFTLLLLWFF